MIILVSSLDSVDQGAEVNLFYSALLLNYVLPHGWQRAMLAAYAALTLIRKMAIDN